VEKTARRYIVKGRVQGVGYRYFAEKVAGELGLTGWVRNLDDGSVEVYAVGSQRQLDDFAGYLAQGPRWAEVRSIEQFEEAVLKLSEFRIHRY
jgi:acylphosphatase